MIPKQKYDSFISEELYPISKKGMERQGIMSSTGVC